LPLLLHVFLSRKPSGSVWPLIIVPLLSRRILWLIHIGWRSLKKPFSQENEHSLFVDKWSTLWTFLNREFGLSYALQYPTQERLRVFLQLMSRKNILGEIEVFNTVLKISCRNNEWNLSFGKFDKFQTNVYFVHDGYFNLLLFYRSRLTYGCSMMLFLGHYE